MSRIAKSHVSSQILALLVVLAACAEPADETAGPDGEPGSAGVASPAPPPAPEPVDLAPSRPADGMAMLPVPAGEFTMGDDASPYPAERPAHRVTLAGYWIDRLGAKIEPAHSVTKPVLN